jgi:hypothetical protein
MAKPDLYLVLAAFQWERVDGSGRSPGSMQGE